jgi:heat shock protein HslJ
MTVHTRRIVGALALVVVAALVVACSAQKTSDLVGKTWQLTQISEKQPMYEFAVPADQQANYTILFNADGTASIKADCNTVGATWKEGAGAGITITPGPSTLVACAPGSQGDRFVRDLGRTVSYGVNGTTLKLTQNDGSELALTAK